MYILALDIKFITFCTFSTLKANNLNYRWDSKVKFKVYTNTNEFISYIKELKDY